MNDELWQSSSSAQQIQALIKVEKDVAKLMRHGAASLQLLRTVQPTDINSSVPLPTGEERSERFVQEASAYFKTLDSIQIGLRRAIAHIREKRITPSTLASLAAQFEAGGSTTSAVLPSVTAHTTDPNTTSQNNTSGNLQEARVERDAWRGIAESLAKLNALHSSKPEEALNRKEEFSMEHI